MKGTIKINYMHENEEPQNKSCVLFYIIRFLCQTLLFYTNSFACCHLNALFSGKIRIECKTLTKRFA